MRILVLNQYFHPDLASTSQLLTELCEDLAEQHDVTVVAGRPSYDPMERRPARGLVSKDRHGKVRVYRTWSTAFPRRSMAGRLTNYATYLASCMAGAFRAESPDVVLTMTDPPLVAATALLASWVRRTPFIYIHQDIFPEVALELGKMREGPFAAGLRRLNRLLRRRAARVVAIGRDMEARLWDQGLSRHKIAVIPNWADGSVLRPLDGPSPLRRACDWGDHFVVMHSGNVGLSQSLGTFLGAAERLREHEDIVFAIVGEGASKAGLQRAAAARRLSNVVFLPYQPKEALSESLGAADLHVVSLQAGLGGYIVPSKVYGILAAGKPFIAAVDEHSEAAMIAREHGCGFPIAPDDPQAMAEAVLQARKAPLKKMGRRGREAFERLYDRPIATEAYRKLLESVAG